MPRSLSIENVILFVVLDMPHSLSTENIILFDVLDMPHSLSTENIILIVVLVMPHSRSSSLYSAYFVTNTWRELQRYPNQVLSRKHRSLKHRLTRIKCCCGTTEIGPERFGVSPFVLLCLFLLSFSYLL